MVALVAALCPACLDGAASPPPRPAAGHIAGRVALNEPNHAPGTPGTFPLQLVPVPHAWVVVTRRSHGRRLTRRVDADAHGRSRLRVPAGCYTVEAQLPHTSTSVGPGTGVCVRSGETARVALSETILIP